jgi:DNA-binding winged helix-turn-helix (wHTH) protein
MHHSFIGDRLRAFLHHHTQTTASAQPTPVIFDRTQQALFRGAGWTPVPPIAARILTALLDHPGSLVSNMVLIRAGWQGEPRGLPDLYKQVHALRVLLEIDPRHPHHLPTRRGVGYLLQDVVELVEDSGADRK